MTDLHAQRSGAPQITIPSLFQSLLQPTSLLPGERLVDFEQLRDSLIEEIEPRSGIEWLWAADLVDLSWDIIRYRTLRQRALEIRRRDAIEAMLRRIDLPGIPQEYLPFACGQTKENAEQWRSDPVASAEIEARLIEQGIDDGSLNAELLIQTRELLTLFDNLIQSAQARRIVLLREINRRRISLEFEQSALPKRRNVALNRYQR